MDNRKEMTLGKYLKRLRKDSGRSQEEISDYLGIKRVTCSAYETDRVVPPADKLYKLSELYGISVELLVSKTVTSNAKGDNKDLRNEEMMYYYRNLKDSQKDMIFELIKELHEK